MVRVVCVHPYPTSVPGGTGKAGWEKVDMFCVRGPRTLDYPTINWNLR